jgi:hypothetical protein
VRSIVLAPVIVIVLLADAALPSVTEPVPLDELIVTWYWLDPVPSVSLVLSLKTAMSVVVKIGKVKAYGPVPALPSYTTRRSTAVIL